MLRQRKSPAKGHRKVVQKDQLRYWRVYTVGLCISRFLSEEICSTWTWKIGIKTRRQILQRHLAPNKNSGKKGPSRGVLQKCVHFMSIVFARRNSRKDHMRRLCTKKDAPAEQHGIWRTYSQAQEFGQSYVLYSYWSKGNDGTHLEKDQRSENSQSIQEHQCTRWAKKAWAHMNWILCEDPGTPLWCLQPMEKCIQTTKHKYTFRDLNLFVTVQLLEETPAVLSLGKLCEDRGYSYEWVSGQKPPLTKEEKTIACKIDNFVPLVVRWLSTSSGSNSSSTSTSQDLSSTSPAQERSDGLAPREWCGSPLKPRTKIKRGMTGKIGRPFAISSWVVGEDR